VNWVVKTKKLPKKRVSCLKHVEAHKLTLRLIAEGDAEAEWLKRIGLGSLVSQIESMFVLCFARYNLMTVNSLTGKMAVDPSMLSSETMSLTARQFEAVRTRVNTLTATMRRKMEQATRTDVREVFSSSPLSPTSLGVSK